MKTNNSDGPTFIPYDDNNMEHVMAGPDYGQVDTGSKESAWSELDSKEYPDYVSTLSEFISKIKFYCGEKKKSY